MAGWIKMAPGMEVGLSPSHIVLDGDPALPPPKKRGPEAPSFQPISIVAKRLDAPPWYGGRPWPRSHCAGCGPSTPQKRGTQPPNYWATSIVAKRLDGSRCHLVVGTAVDHSPGDIVLDGDPALPPPKGHSPQFSAHVYCGQTAEWMKTLLGTEVDLGPGHTMLDRHPVPP